MPPAPWSVPARILAELHEVVVLLRELRAEVAALREEVAGLRADVSSVPFVGRRG